jgi:hypothetical protein
MRKLFAISLLGLGLLLGGAPAAAEARPPLDYTRAVHNAEREARKLARQDTRIAEWEIARGFRFTSTKWVFAWWSQLDDGRVCTAQLVTRYRNSKQDKVISYFRNEDCG